MKKTLVLGLGNILLRDEGVGVRVVERLQQRYRFPADVEVLDGGTLGLNLLSYVETAERLLVVDALDMDAAPGTLARLEGDEVPAALSMKLSIHQAGLADLLATARLRGCCPQDLVLWGVQPGVIEVGLDLSPPVDARVEALADRAVEELGRWEIRFIQNLDPQEGR
jgi:hydrogenase maturation protease